LAEVRAWYPGAEAEPAPEPHPPAELAPEEAALVAHWLDVIGETCPATRAEVLARADGVALQRIAAALSPPA
jgi:hypothetical protein